MHYSTVLPVQDASHIGSARREIQRLAIQLGLSPEEAGTLSIVITEAAANLVKHAGGGQLIARPLHSGGVPGLEVLAVDTGPGMPDVTQCIEDGYSTAGSPGTGLGAIRRVSTAFDVYSLPGKGTVLLSQYMRGRKVEEGRVAGVALAHHGETVCGDAWICAGSPDRLVVAVADGLGHGPIASEASEEAMRIVAENATKPALEILNLAHRALHKTRGAAMAVAEVDSVRGKVRYAGVGNIAARIFLDGNSTSMMSHNGIVGHQFGRTAEFEYACPEGALLLMHSDGLHSRWDLTGHPGLLAKHPSIIAAVLTRDFHRGRDDATVVAVRQRQDSGS